MGGWGLLAFEGMGGWARVADVGGDRDGWVEVSVVCWERV